MLCRCCNKTELPLGHQYCNNCKGKSVGQRIRTDFEDKPLKVIMRTWLYSNDDMEILRAAIEMRRRWKGLISEHSETTENTNGKVI
jgi:hypothetical protein